MWSWCWENMLLFFFIPIQKNHSNASWCFSSLSSFFWGRCWNRWQRLSTSLHKLLFFLIRLWHRSLLFTTTGGCNYCLVHYCCVAGFVALVIHFLLILDPVTSVMAMFLELLACALPFFRFLSCIHLNMVHFIHLNMGQMEVGLVRPYRDANLSCP